MVRLYQETLIPVLLPVLVPVQNLPQSQSVAIKTPNPLILLFWRRSLSPWIVSGRRVVGRTAILRCGRKTVWNSWLGMTIDLLEPITSLEEMEGSAVFPFLQGSQSTHLPSRTAVDG
jgi:hypothetical protein